MKVFWAKKKSTNTGSTTSVLAAISMFHLHHCPLQQQPPEQQQPAATEEQMLPGQPHTTANILPWMIGNWEGNNYHYTFYEDVPRLWGLSATRDQSLGGILMNGEQTLVFLLAIGYFVMRLLDEEHAAVGEQS